MSNDNSSSGIGFHSLLTILFIALKLTGYVNWSWLWVLSPLWISFTLIIVVYSVMGIVYLASKATINGKAKKEENRSTFQEKLEQAIRKQKEDN